MPKLYEDYRQVNAYVIEKYNVDDRISIPADFESEELAGGCVLFERKEIVEEFMNN